MRSAILVSAFMLFILGNIAVAQPEMYIAPKIFDFGYITGDCKVSHVFKIHNTGSDSLKIAQVKPGCGCTKAPLGKDALAPDETTELEIIFSNGKRTGSTTKFTAIHTNERIPMTRISIKAYTIRNTDTIAVTIDPMRLVIPKSEKVEISSRTFAITNSSEVPVSATVVSEPEGYFDIRLPEQIGPGQTAEATIIIHDDHLDETFEKSFTLEFTDEAKTRYSIPVLRRDVPAGLSATGK